MNIKKINLGELERVYATTIMELHERMNFIVASEGPGSCLAFDVKTHEQSTVWDTPGGTMNIVPIPGKKNEFIASQKFLPTFNAQDAIIVHAVYNEDRCWEINPIMKTPYLHRFDLFEYENELYFIGASLCEAKEFRDDWSSPGKVVIGKLPEKLDRPFQVDPVIERITKNHGFCSAEFMGKKVFLITGHEGLFVLNREKDKGGHWVVDKIFDFEISDVAVCDIDSDGVEEIITIEPFHGDKGKIYKLKEGKWIPVYTHSCEFGHVVWGGKLRNVPSFIIGERKGNMKLVCLQYDDKEKAFQEILIDNTGGPSNIAVRNGSDRDLILAANRQVGEIAVYEIT